MKDIKVKVLGRLSSRLYNLYKEVMNIREGDVLLFCDYSEFDIPVGYSFTQVLKRDNTAISCKVLLRGVSQQFLKPFDEIPHGWKTVCRFEFVDGYVPDEIDMLPLLETWVDTGNYLVFE